MRVTLSLTHRCNLACRYCYAGRAFNCDMSLETARKIVDYALLQNPVGHPLRFQFFGGEPLLCFETLRATAQYIRQQSATHGIHTSIGVTSNGTILNQAMIDTLRAYDIDLCFSIDGPAHIHDQNRRFKNGRGSYAIVMQNLTWALEALESIQANMVYGPETLETLPDGVQLLVDAGVRAIHINPNITASWPREAETALHDAFQRIAMLYIASYEQGHEIAIGAIDSKIILFLKGGYSLADMCCMGDGELAFAPSGNVYPCERFIGEDRDPTFCIGHIDTGIDLARRCALHERRGNRNEQCRSCGWRRYCMNWCGCTNYAMTGRIDIAGPALCAIERATIDAARQAFQTLSDRGNQLFLDHYLRYSHEYQQRHYSPIAP